MNLLTVMIPLMAALVCGPMASGADDSAADMAAIEVMRDVQLEVAARPLKDLESKYREALEKKRASAQESGNLEYLMAAKSELELLAAGNDTAALPKQADLAKLRQIHTEQKSRITPQVETAVLTVEREYGKQLNKLVVDLTKAGKTDEALKVKQKVDAFAKELQARQQAKRQTPAVAAASAPAAPSPNGATGKTMNVNLPGGVVMTFCYCPPGEFKMGSPPDEVGRGLREDQTKARLTKGYWMARTECIQKQWVAIMGTNPSQFKGNDLPIEQVDWNTAHQFVKKLNEAKVLPAGFMAALPTEAQWEFACRAGTKTPYSFGKSLRERQANFGKRDSGKTAIVGTYPPNAWGLHEMHGNVYEWCSDWLSEKLPGGDDPTGSPTGEFRTMRGGSWANGVESSRSAARGLFRSNEKSHNVGFRVACNAIAGDGGQ